MAEPLVHRSALPSHAAPEELRVRPGPDGSVAIDPTRAGWRYLSFRVARLSVGEEVSIGRPGQEAVIVNLFGGDVQMSLGDGEAWLIGGRESVFDRPPSALYLPAGQPATVRPVGRGSTAATVLAIAEAPSRPKVAASLQPVAIQPDQIRLETRGSGHATRQIRHLVPPNFPPTGCCSWKSSRRPAIGRAGRRTSTTSTRCPMKPSSKRFTTTGFAGRRLGRSSASTGGRSVVCRLAMYCGRYATAKSCSSPTATTRSPRPPPTTPST